MISHSLVESTVFPVLAPAISRIMRLVPDWLINEATEVRLRAGQPLLIMAGRKDFFLGSDGCPVTDSAAAYICSRDDLARTLQLISRNSLYAFEQELKMGYFTIPGGHRIGLAGQAIMNESQLKALKNIGAMNIRLAREIIDSSKQILPYVLMGSGHVLSTLLVGPPRTGKTTMLRDLARQISTGVPSLSFRGVQVGVVDERSEIAACRDGVPSADLGPRVDVLDGCPKATGMLMLIRSMSPQVIVTDELGRQEDANAIQEALHAGVSVIATVHGKDVEDIKGRPYIGELIRQKLFDRYVVLGDAPCIGSIQMVVSVKREEVLYLCKKEVRECG